MTSPSTDALALAQRVANLERAYGLLVPHLQRAAHTVHIQNHLHDPGDWEHCDHPWCVAIRQALYEADQTAQGRLP